MENQAHHKLKIPNTKVDDFRQYSKVVIHIKALSHLQKQLVLSVDIWPKLRLVQLEIEQCNFHLNFSSKVLQKKGQQLKSVLL